MNDQIISHLKMLETIGQSMTQSVKTIENTAERLRSIENLLERVVAAVEAQARMTQIMVEANDQQLRGRSRQG